VAGLVLLHAGRPADRFLDPRVAAVANQKRLRRLGAILRVADGLDHGHIQDAEITTMRLRNQVLYVTVRSDGYVGNVAWADRKADLWREVMPVDIRLVAAPRAKSKGPFHRAVPKDADVVDAARRILALQYRIAADNRDGALDGSDPEALHDLRVALRRARAALRFFRPLVAVPSARALGKGLADITSRLGPVRDAEVWLAFLDEAQAAIKDPRDPAWLAYRERQQALHERRRVLKEILSGDATCHVMDQMAYLVRIELPALQRALDPEPYRAVAGKKVRRAYKRLCEGRRSVRRMSADEAHSLRKRCKRVRYWAEFTEMVLGPGIRRLGVCLKAVTGALGDLHDMDVHLEESVGENAPGELRHHMVRVRKEALDRADAAWRCACEKSFRQTIMKRLSEKQRRR
jgi:CHAD domain-containing protein